MLSILLAVAAAAAQVPAPEPAGPTAIEHALVEFLCRGTYRAIPGTDTYQDCYHAQLSSLRDSFGQDLGRLAAADRRAIDTACGALRDTRGPDAYLACLNAQLTAVRGRLGGTPPSEEGAPLAPVTGASTDRTADAAVDTAPAADAGWSRFWWVAGFVALAAVAGAGAFVWFRRTRSAGSLAEAVPVSGNCRSCGARVAGVGDLCPACRHDLAEARRREAAERMAAGDEPHTPGALHGRFS